MSDALIELPKRKRGRPSKYAQVQEAKIDLTKAVKYRSQGLSYREIGIQLCPDNPISPQAVHQALQRFHSIFDAPENTLAYAANKTQVLEAVEEKLLTSLLDDAALQKASLNNRAYAYQQVSSSLRAERGPVGLNLSIPGSLQQAFTLAITVGPVEKAQPAPIVVNPQPEPTTDCGADGDDEK